MTDQNIKGGKELFDFLQQLPVKMEKNIMRGALRQGGNALRDEARDELRANGSEETGQLADGLKVRVSARYGTVKATVAATGPHGYIAPWVEYGTAAHEIEAKRAKAVSLGGDVDGFAADGLVFAHVQHPGAKPHPFMRPALEKGAPAAVVASAEYIKTRLTKQGLEGAADVDVGSEP